VKYNRLVDSKGKDHGSRLVWLGVPVCVIPCFGVSWYSLFLCPEMQKKRILSLVNNPVEVADKIGPEHAGRKRSRHRK